MRSAAKLKRLKALVCRLALLKVARRGLLAFALLFLGHLLSDACCAYHTELCAQLDWAVAPGRRLVGALPREHAKTTLGTLALVLRELCLRADSPSGGKRNILLVAANREEAAAKLRLIVNEMESNPRLLAAFGALLRPLRDAHSRTVAYADHSIILAGGVRVGTLGFGGKVRGQLSAGRRLDLVILDDPEDDASTASPRVRERRREWVDRALLNALDARRGSLVWLGSLLHHDSVLARKLKEHETEGTGDLGIRDLGIRELGIRELGKRELDQGAGGGATGNAASTWRTLRRAAIGDDGLPLWPGRWSSARLNARRAEIGECAFAQEYQNNPVSLSQQVFVAERFGCYDPTGLCHCAGQWTLDGVPLTIAVGVDPAIGAGAQHDYFAAVVLGLARGCDLPGALAEEARSQPHIFVLDVLRLKRPFAEQLAQLTALCRRWKPRVLGIEAVAYQAALAQAAWDAGLPVQALSGTARKYARIEAAAVHQAGGRIYLPAQCAWVAALRQEAAEYPAGAHDDQLDALARALEAGLPLSGGGWEISGGGARATDAKGFV